MDVPGYLKPSHEYGQPLGCGPLVAEVVGCPVCGATAEPEEEDGLVKYSCTSCQYEFGFTRVAQEQDSCSLGVPEQVRRGLSDVMQPTGYGTQEPQAPVFLGQIGRKPDE